MSQAHQRRLAVTISTLAISVAGAGTATAMQRQATSPSTPPSSAQLMVTRVADAHDGGTESRRPSVHHSVARSSISKVGHPIPRHRVRRDPTAQRPAAAGSRRMAPPRAHHRHWPRVTGPTGWPALDGAIARIPSYRSGAALWVVSNKYGHWGTADWYHDTLYISPGVPTARVYDVAVHEWSHELSVLDYAGDVDAATAAMNATFGGSGLTGAERAADCMAILQGAMWTHYTSCHDGGWRHAAATLLAGRQP